VADASVVVMLTNWPEYRQLDVTRMEGRAGASPLLIDCWRAYRDWPFQKFAYRAFGIGAPAPDESAYDTKSDILYKDDRRRAAVLERTAVQHPAFA
jgi:hypothetical protein